MQNDTKVLARSAIFIALIMIGAQISIPLPSLVPISLQTLAIYMCALMCEKKHALLITLVYVFMGAIGLPVFAGFTGGASHVFGPSGGFIFGFPVMAFMISAIAYKSDDVKVWSAAMLAGTIVLYAIGTLYFMYVTKSSMITALSSCVLPFIPGDLIKIAVSCIIVKHVKKFVVQKKNIVLNNN